MGIRALAQAACVSPPASLLSVSLLECESPLTVPVERFQRRLPRAGLLRHLQVRGQGQGQASATHQVWQVLSLPIRRCCFH